MALHGGNTMQSGLRRSARHDPPWIYMRRRCLDALVRAPAPTRNEPPCAPVQSFVKYDYSGRDLYFEI